MQIDLLYFDGCPSWQEALENLKAALAAEGLQAEIRLILVKDDADATQLQFLGSPSFRVNGVELWHEQRAQYALSCRVYSTPQGMKGVPTVEMLREKLGALRK
jgi:protein-disulfide isomerase